VTGYGKRAAFYRSEFAVRDDFPLLGRLLAGAGGLVADIPSGAGRLLPLHQAHGCEVIMVDIEPAMTAQCRKAVTAAGLVPRVGAVCGDITTWRAPRPASRMVVARGGLQMLPTPLAITQALTASAANLAPAGLLYLDVAMPWTMTPAAAPQVAPFLRFIHGTRLEGHSCIQASGMRIRRSYLSTLLPDQVTVHFRYEADGPAAEGWRDFETDATWLRVEAATVTSTLESSGLTVLSTLGDYTGTPYTPDSARFICIAAAQ
jgi:SAM-dependent methyltransferase